ncbi:hypothetical protein ES705_48509 [subsurface metagenome]
MLDEAEFKFICDAIIFIAQNGIYFLKLYEFNLYNGKWHYKDFKKENITFGLNEALAIKEVKPKTDDKAAPELYRSYLDGADKLARRLKKDFSEADIKTTEAKLIPFMYINLCG